MAASDDELKKFEEQQKRLQEYQTKATQDLKGYFEILEKIGSLKKNINYIESQNAKLTKENIVLTQKLADTSGRYSADQQDAFRRRQAIINATIANGDEVIKNAKTELALLQEINNTRNAGIAIGRSTLKLGKSYLSNLYSQKGYLLEQQKAVKNTELSMGILSKQSGFFRANIYKAALTTTDLGVDTAQLAQYQGNYSEQIGRSVALSEQSLIAMSQLAQGTVLGAEGAASMAAEMENFGISVTGTRDIVEEMLDTAHKMGVNSAKVTKNLQGNLKLAQRYHFKGGISGMVKMAAMAAKFKIEMSSIAGFADKLFTPEGAVEMASQLQVLGGEWSKLADPFTLMYKARHDMAGLQEEVINATKGMAEFNKETGEFELSGLELHRLREIAQATGMDMEQLAQSAKEVAKFSKIEGQITGFGFSKEDKETIAAIAEFDAKTGKYTINADGFKGSVDKLHTISAQDRKKLIDQIKNDKATLEERAKQAQTFDEQWKNIILTLKQTLLPFIEGISKGLEPALTKFREWIDKDGGFNKLADTAKYFGERIGEIITWASNNPWKSLAAIVGFKAAEWYARGTAMGLGFNSVANGGGKGIGSMVKGFKEGGLGGFAKSAGGKNLIGGGVAALGGAALMGGRQLLPEKHREGAVGQTMGVLGGAASGAGTGAMIGSFISPLGTAIGAALGGVIGGGMAAYNEGMFGGQMANDFIMRPNEKPMKFSSADTVVGFKGGGPIEKVMGNGSGKGTMEVSFKPLKIEGTLNVTSANGNAAIDLSDPIFAREISRVIQEELRRSIGGGKLSPNPL